MSLDPVVTRATFQHPLSRERVSRCSVDLRGGCTRVLVVVVATSSSSCPPARLHAVSTRVILSVTSGQLHLRISSRRPKLVINQRANLVELADHRCSSARAASSSHTDAVESCSFFQMMYSIPSDSSSAVLSSPGSMIVTFLSTTTSPCRCWNSRTTPQDVRPSLRSPSQGSFGQPTWRPSCISCVHQFCDSSVACSTTCFT